jgi:uncharacterized protein (TIGR02996 family)
MTRDQQTGEGFEVALDANPTDRVTRLAYADWLDEHDRLEDAAVQRWLAGRGQWARPSPPAPDTPRTWDWWNGGRDSGHASTREADLPADLYALLPADTSVGPDVPGLRDAWIEYANRREAERALARALVLWQR